MSKTASNPVKPAFHSTAMLLIVCGLAMTATGCTTLRLPALPAAMGGLIRAEASETDYSLGPGSQTDSMPKPVSAGSEAEQIYYAGRQAKSQNSIVLHIPSDDSPVRVLPLPPENNAVYVSTLLKQTGVQKKLGTIEATLYRYSSGSIGGLPMECKMTKDGKSIRPESDYALQPGDRLKVQKSTSPALTGLVNMVLGI